MQHDYILSSYFLKRNYISLLPSMFIWVYVCLLFLCIVNSHYMVWPDWPFSGVKVVCLREMLFCFVIVIVMICYVLHPFKCSVYGGVRLLISFFASVCVSLRSVLMLLEPQQAACGWPLCYVPKQCDLSKIEFQLCEPPKKLHRAYIHVISPFTSEWNLLLQYNYLHNLLYVLVSITL